MHAAAPDPEASRAVFKDRAQGRVPQPGGRGPAAAKPVPKETLPRPRLPARPPPRAARPPRRAPASCSTTRCNIRYALDVSNMQVWMLHNAIALRTGLRGRPRDRTSSTRVRASSPKASRRSTRCARPSRWFFFTAGRRQARRAAEDMVADEIADIVREHGGGNLRLAVDKIEPRGRRCACAGAAYHGRGPGTRPSMRAQSRSPEEIELMRWTVSVCEAGMARMYEQSVPGQNRAGDLGGASSREHPLGRRMAGDAATRHRPAHQPVVPGMLRPRRPGRRHARLRHRHDRSLWLLRRPVALVDHRPRRDEQQAARALLRRARADRPQPRVLIAWHELPPSSTSSPGASPRGHLPRRY